MRMARLAYVDEPDPQLVTLARGQGDEDAAAELWRRYFHRVQRSAQGGEDNRSDVVTDAFIGAVRSFPERVEMPDLTFGSWWHRRVRWARSRPRYRDRSTWETATDALPEVPTVDPDPIESWARRDCIRAALEGLTNRQRRVFVLRFVHGYSVDELSAVEDMTPEAARALLMRARHSFRERYRTLADGVGVF